MNLAIDIGNTKTKFAIYQRQTQIDYIEYHSSGGIVLNKIKPIIKLIQKCESCGISSVVPSLTNIFNKYIKENYGIVPIIINNKIKLPINIKVNNSNSLGSDRICNAVFGYLYFGKKFNVITCSFGTANTVDVVLKNGDYIGGLIAPGIELSSNSLANTGKLPVLKPNDLKLRKSVIGKNTKQAIESGLLNYPFHASVGIIKAIEKEYRAKFKVIITGGNGKLLYKKFPLSAKYAENTVLPGINYILNNL